MFCHLNLWKRLPNIYSSSLSASSLHKLSSRFWICLIESFHYPTLNQRNIKNPNNQKKYQNWEGYYFSLNNGEQIGRQKNSQGDEDRQPDIQVKDTSASVGDSQGLPRSCFDRIRNLQAFWNSSKAWTWYHKRKLQLAWMRYEYSWFVWLVDPIFMQKINVHDIWDMFID